MIELIGKVFEDNLNQKLTLALANGILIEINKIISVHNAQRDVNVNNTSADTDSTPADK